jgi:hypothetical protein
MIKHSIKYNNLKYFQLKENLIWCSFDNYYLFYMEVGSRQVTSELQAAEFCWNLTE